jgi:hypothetical protein
MAVGPMGENEFVGKYYMISTAIYGQMRFQARYDKKDGQSFSVDKLKFVLVDDAGNDTEVFQYLKSGQVNEGKAAPLSLTFQEVNENHRRFGVINNNKISSLMRAPQLSNVGIFYSVDGVKNRTVAGRSDSEALVNAITKDPVALSLYLCAESMIPYIATSIKIAQAFADLQMSSARISMTENIRLMWQMEASYALLNKAQGSLLMRILRNPWFHLALGIAGAVTTVATTVKNEAGLCAAIVASICILILLACVLWLTEFITGAWNWLGNVKDAVFGSAEFKSIFEMPETEKSDFDKLEEEARKWGIDPNSTDENDQLLTLYKDLRNTLIVGYVLMAVALPAFMFLTYANASKNGLQTLETMGIALTAIIGGITSIIKGMMEFAIAESEFSMEKEKIESERWLTEEKFYKELLKRFEETIKTLLQSVQDLIKSQAEIVRTLGEGKLSIVRNFTTV